MDITFAKVEDGGHRLLQHTAQSTWKLNALGLNSDQSVPTSLVISQQSESRFVASRHLNGCPWLCQTVGSSIEAQISTIMEKVKKTIVALKSNLLISTCLQIIRSSIVEIIF